MNHIVNIILKNFERKAKSLIAFETGAHYFCSLKTAPWCNGSTADSGSVSPGSNPGGATSRA